jgi:multidrug efflux pump subunit AcrA (membrane-fusion protein)
VLLNMAARVSFLRRAIPIEQRSVAPRVTIPVAALTERGGAPCVFVFTQSGAVKMAVQKGEVLGSDAEIASGLKPGERVILSPPKELEDGRAVELLP